ncbi:uncharacterized protein V6R79_009335 [Siganus canaliculatus]
MAVAYGAALQPGLLSQQYPPPLLPKPGKDNVRLQKLLKRSAKKKASAQASQSAGPFRSSLSPVNEASPDLEHSDHSTPPKTPETPISLYTAQHPPRFTVRPLYQHVASPYPQRATYGRAARYSPQTVAMPTSAFSQHVTTVSSYSSAASSAPVPVTLPVTVPAAPKISQADYSVPETTIPTVQVIKPVAETPSSFTPEAAPQLKHTGPGPTPYQATGVQSLIRPLTVLTPIVKCKSPRPTFKATEPSRSPKPMFDVPQIRLYTASTSYYETSRTPPVYDSTGLTAIGNTTQNKTSPEVKPDLAQATLLGTDSHRKTPTLETKRGATPTSELKRATPTSELKRATPTSELKRATPTSELKRATPTSELKRATPTSELKRATPTTELKRATPTSELKRATPTSELKRATPTSELKRATPTTELKRATPTSELKRATPTSEIRVKTPTHELQTPKTSVGRPRTPAYQKTRAPTPVFEISRPNPLLFAVSSTTAEAEKSNKTVGSSSAPPSAKTPESKPAEAIMNGDLHADLTPAVQPKLPSIAKSKSEPDLTRENIQTTASQTPEPTTPAAASSYGQQRPKTPTFEATRLLTTSPGYKRPKTPTYGTSPLGVSSVAFQRPKTPTQVAQKSKSGYRGLTPAEYAAYGGIKAYTPAFGFSGSPTQFDTEVKTTKEEPTATETPTPEPPAKVQAVVKESPKDETKAADASFPVIIVSQASDSGTSLTKASTESAAKQVKTETQKVPEVKPVAVVKSPDKQKAQAAQEVAKPQSKPTAPKGDQDPLKAVRKLLGKERVQTAEQKSEAKLQPVKPAVAPKSKDEGPKPSTALLEKAPAAASSKDKTSEPGPAVKSASEKKEGDESLPPAEPLLKVLQKPKGMKTKLSGWSRLKKHMVVEQEEPKFPETDSPKEATDGDQSGAKKDDEKAGGKPGAQEETQTMDSPKATKMWDAVLFQMFSTKENIMHQIEMNKATEEEEEEVKDESKEIPSFAYRLPVLLFSPKFDAKKLREAASRPVTKISTVFEMGLIGRKGKDEEPKDFNRTARGFTAT